MALNEENAFSRGDVLPSWWANAVQRFLSTLAPGTSLVKSDATHIQVPAGAGDQAAILAIAGRWRWNEATVSRAHPGGAAGTYDIYAVAVANSIVSTPEPGTDTTNYAWDLRILEAGKVPAISPGTVDIFRKLGSLEWSGTEITRVDQIVPIAPTHAHRHAAGQPDALAPADISALETIESTAALRPAAARRRLHRATDTGAMSYDTGAAWQPVDGPTRAANLPTAQAVVPEGVEQSAPEPERWAKVYLQVELKAGTSNCGIVVGGKQITAMAIDAATPTGAFAFSFDLPPGVKWHWFKNTGPAGSIVLCSYQMR